VQITEKLVEMERRERDERNLVARTRAATLGKFTRLKSRMTSYEFKSHGRLNYWPPRDPSLVKRSRAESCETVGASRRSIAASVGAMRHDAPSTLHCPAWQRRLIPGPASQTLLRVPKYAAHAGEMNSPRNAFAAVMAEAAMASPLDLPMAGAQSQVPVPPTRTQSASTVQALFAATNSLQREDSVAQLDRESLPTSRVAESDESGELPSGTWQDPKDANGSGA
jgi:hypothetical protein